LKPTDVRRFASPDALRDWLEANHAAEDALWIAIAKKNATAHVVTHAQALDLALAYGWIDGFVGKLDDTHYALRFTRRRAKSNWSAVNLKRFAELQAAGLVRPAGQAAFDRRDRAVSEERPAVLTPALARIFQAQRAAWAFFRAQPPGYRRQAAWYVMSARTEATQLRRLDRVIESSAAGVRLPALTGGTRAVERPTAATGPAKAASTSARTLPLRKKPPAAATFAVPTAQARGRPRKTPRASPPARKRPT